MKSNMQILLLCRSRYVRLGAVNIFFFLVYVLGCFTLTSPQFDTTENGCIEGKAEFNKSRD